MILRRLHNSAWRGFSTTVRRGEIKDIENLEDRIIPRYQGKLCHRFLEWNLTLSSRNAKE